MAAIRGVDCKGICNECGKNLKGLGGIECYATRGSTFLCVDCLEELLPKVKDVVEDSKYKYKVGDTVFLDLYDSDKNLIDTCIFKIIRTSKTLASIELTTKYYISYTHAIPINFNKDLSILVKPLSGNYCTGEITRFIKGDS